MRPGPVPAKAGLALSGHAQIREDIGAGANFVT
jgi:hypothetical protein